MSRYSFAKRMDVLTNLYFKYGAPEDLRITVKSTGEKIWLHFGLPVTLTKKGKPFFPDPYVTPKSKHEELATVTLTRVCVACKGEFRAERITAKFCSTRCRMKWKRQEEFRETRREMERMAG